MGSVLKGAWVCLFPRVFSGFSRGFWKGFVFLSDLFMCFLNKMNICFGMFFYFLKGFFNKSKFIGALVILEPG